MGRPKAEDRGVRVNVYLTPARRDRLLQIDPSLSQAILKVIDELAKAPATEAPKPRKVRGPVICPRHVRMGYQAPLRGCPECAQ